MRLEGGLDVRIPSPVLNLLLQSLHILKHALGWGIGLRQLCDMARSCYKLHDEVESEEMKRLHYNWEWTDGSSCYMHFGGASGTSSGVSSLSGDSFRFIPFT